MTAVTTALSSFSGHGWRGASLTSLAGNVAHALLSAPAGSWWLAAAVAAVPPTVLLCAVHGIAVLAKTNASSAVYWVSVAATAALAGGAFVLSFVSLRALALLESYCRPCSATRYTFAGANP